MNQPTDIAEVRRLCEANAHQLRGVSDYEHCGDLSKAGLRMANEIERLRDLIDRCDIELAQVAHGDECGCDLCEVAAEVRRVNRETA